MKYRMSFPLLLALLSGCTTEVQSNPPRTATEEMLISAAAERAAAKLALVIPQHTRIFVDNSNFEGTDAKYAMACIRSHLLQNGAHLTDDRKKAGAIVETRAGALSTDRRTFMIGTPQFNIPIPFAPAPLPFPQISFYSTEEQKGVAKFAVTEYDAKTGMLISAQEPQYGFAHNTKKTILFIITWTDRDYMPEDATKDKSK